MGNEAGKGRKKEKCCFYYYLYGRRRKCKKNVAKITQVFGRNRNNSVKGTKEEVESCYEM